MNKTGTGMVYWLTGLSGAGKTTIGKHLYARLKLIEPNVVFLDGDILRGVFGNNVGHSVEERKELALSYARLCKMLSDQGMDVVCATMSLFSEVHEFNRENIKRYVEVFIECDMDELKRRDQKGIYSRALKGELDNVVGVNLPYDRPKDCNLVIDNTSMDTLDEKVEKILGLSVK